MLERALRRGRAGPVPGAGLDCRVPRDRARSGRHRLGRDRRPLRRAREDDGVAGRGAEPRGRRGDGVRPRSRARDHRHHRGLGRVARLPPAPRHARRSAAPPRPSGRSRGRVPRGLTRSRAPTPSGATSAAGSTTSRSLPSADDVERAPGPEPLDLLVAERVRALEIDQLALGLGDPTPNRSIGRERGQIEHRDAVVFADPVVRAAGSPNVSGSRPCFFKLVSWMRAKLRARITNAVAKARFHRSVLARRAFAVVVVADRAPRHTGDREVLRRSRGTAGSRRRADPSPARSRR